MIKLFIKLLFIFFIFSNSHASNFSKQFLEKVFKVRSEINKNNLDNAVKLLGKIEIQNENEEEQINLLFGDIYLKINQPSKAEEFYEKSFMTTDENIESLTFIGLAEVKLAQGNLSGAIDYSEKSIFINPDRIRPKLILATAKYRLGDVDESNKILNDLYNSNKNNSQVNLALSDYYVSIDQTFKAISILEDYLRLNPTNFEIMDHVGNLYWFDKNKDKALEYKFKVFKYYQKIRNRKKSKEIKNWIESIEPDYFTKKSKRSKLSKENKEKNKKIEKKKEEEKIVENEELNKKEEEEIVENEELNKKEEEEIVENEELNKKEEEEIKQHEEEEIKNYNQKKIIPNYEEFEFAINGNGSGFIVGNGKYVITNNHVIEKAKRVAVRNGIGKVSNARVLKTSEKYDLAILQLEIPYPSEYSIKAADFEVPKFGDDVISIGYPGIGMTYDKPTITQGIISKVFNDDVGVFMTTAATNSGNSGGPIFNLKGNLVGVTFAKLAKVKYLIAEGDIPTDMGYAIKSNLIKKVFEHEENPEIKTASYNKVEIYERMLPSVVLVGVQTQE